MSSRVYESCILSAPLERVWAAVRPLDFKFLFAAVASAKFDDSKHKYNTVGSVRTITYKDKDSTKQKIRLAELSEHDHHVTWELVTSEPDLTYSGVTHTIRLRRVTSGDGTFVEFTSDFSKDASTDVIYDSVYKKHDFFKALANVTENRAASYVRGLNFWKLQHLSSKEVAEMWASFDTNNDGFLDATECGKIAEALFERIDNENAGLHALLQGMFSEPESAATEEKKETSSSASSTSSAAASSTSSSTTTATAAAAGTESAKDKKVAAKLAKGHKAVAKGVSSRLKRHSAKLKGELLGACDTNKDGKIDFAEFKSLFPRWLTKKIHEQLDAYWDE